MTEDTNTTTLEPTTEDPTNPAELSFPADGKWTIRNMPPGERAAAIAAARRADTNIAAWLAEAIRFYIDRERAASFDAADHDVMPPGQALVPVAPSPKAAISIDEIGRAVQIAAQIAELRGTKVSARLAGRANRLLAERLRDAV